MKRFAQLLSGLALISTLTPALLYLNDRVSLESMKSCMLIATVVWFVATPLWMGRGAKSSAS
jgi:hypothetical protein